MVEQDVKIPISLEVKETGDITKYVDKVKSELSKIQKSMPSDMSIVNTQAIQDAVTNITGMVDSLEKSSASLDKYQQKYQLIADTAATMASQMKEGVGVFAGATDDELKKMEASAARAKQNYYTALQSAQTTANKVSSSISQEIASIEQLQEAEKKGTQTTDLFKKAMEDYKNSVQKASQQKFLDTHGMSEIKQTINDIKQAVDSARNSVDGLYKTVGNKRVQVSPFATDELEDAYSWIEFFADDLIRVRGVFESLESQISDGTIDQTLKENGESTEEFKSQVVQLRDECTASIKELMQYASLYSTLAQGAAKTATDIKNNVVTEAKTATPGSASKLDNSEDKERIRQEEELRKKIEETRKAREEATKAAVKEKQEEIASIKQTAAQYYYKLRAVKMLGFTIKDMTAKLNTFMKTTISATGRMLKAYLRIIPGVNALRKALDKTHSSQKKLNSEMKKSGKDTKLMNVSLKQLITSLLKYGLGIKSIYLAFKKLRSEIIDGLGSMSKQFDHVNARMSSIVSSLNYMKAAITSVVEPLLTALAPALEKISALFADVTYKIASFIAALTGQSTVLKAIRVETDYAKSLDKTAKSAKEATKELGKYDKLNVIHKDKDSGDEDFGGMAWKEVPIDETMKGWADALKEFLNKLLAPIKAAWNKIKKFVIDSWKYMCNQLKLLWQDVARDFWKVWEEADTQKIFENIFITLGDIFLIIGNIAKGLREAWNHNDNGYRMLSAIRDVVLIISEGIREIADYTVKWSSELSFIPLFDSLANTLNDKIVPAVEKVKDLFVILYEQVILKIVELFIEKGLPQLVELFGTVSEIIGIIAEKIRIALQSGSNAINIVYKIADLCQILLNGIKDIAEKTKEWAEELDLRPLMVAIKDGLEEIKPLIQFISDAVSAFWTETLLPLWKYLLEEGFPKLLDAIGEIVQGADWETITANVQNLFSALEPIFELSWEVLVQLIKDFGQALMDFLGSDTFTAIVDNIKAFSDNFASMSDEERAKFIEDLTGKIKLFTGALIGLVGAFNLVSNVVLPLITNFMTFKNMLAQGAMTKSVTDLTAQIGALIGKGSGASATGLTGLISKLGAIAVPVAIVVAVLALMTASFGGIKETLEELKERFDAIKDAISQFAEQIHFGDTLDRLKESFGRLGESAQTLRPLFEFLLDILKDVAIVIGETVLGAIDGFLIAVDGVINFISGVLGAIGGIVEMIKALVLWFSGDNEGAYELAEKGWEDFVSGLGEIFYGVLEFIEGTFDLVAEAIAGFVNLVCPGLAQGITDFCNNVKEAFAWLKNILIGDPIVYDISDGIIEGFSEWIKDTLEAVTGWIKDIKDKFDEIKQKVEEKVKAIKEKIETTLSKENLKRIGDNALNSLKSAAESGFNRVRSAVSNASKNVISTLKSLLSTSVFKSIGRFIPDGLKEGIANGLSALLSTVRNVSNTVIRTFKDIFGINSPSKVTEGFGENLMQGLEIGIDEESEDEMIPTEFADNFVDYLADMKVEALDIVSSMVDEIEKKVSSLTLMETLSSQLNAIAIPDIALGSVLPSNVQFKQTDTKLDERTLKKAIQEAVDEVVSSIDFNSNNQPIMLQLDSRTVAECVWDEEEKRYKQRGSSYSPIFSGI